MKPAEGWKCKSTHVRHADLPGNLEPWSWSDVAMGVVTLPGELDIGLVWTHLYGGDPFDA